MTTVIEIIEIIGAVVAAWFILTFIALAVLVRGVREMEDGER